MSKKEWIIFVLMNIANYLLVLFAAVFYYLGASLLYPVMLLTQSFFTWRNYIVAKKVWHLSILSVNLLLSTIISHIVSTTLYMQNISNDFETLIVGKYAVVIGSIYVIIISLIAIGIKFVIIKTKSKTE